ncbi:MAG: hypothetical protein JNJ77_15015 [Planctomycetia bacterium]|nr:hypothetical protein [Planctomycetia bacterium]
MYFRSAFSLIVLSIYFCSMAAQEVKQPPAIDVILWFDTEDYILPDSDDAALQLATWLTEHKIQATFKVVGEKARTLERRGRTDVINALKKHEIGYHSNWHSIPPTPTQYLDACGWLDGVAEFTRREKPGYDDVVRIFGQKPTCYGQPGSSWGPQSHAALKSWGMNIYLDAGRHIDLDGKPFWYGGLLNFYRLKQQIRVGLFYPHELEEARIRFLQARDQLLAEGGGVISIVYHPCEFVHQQFWDGVNFKHGANPPRDQWKLPPVKIDAEKKQAFHNFEQYIAFMKRFPDVRFVTATQAAAAYPDKARKEYWTYLEVEKLALDASRNFHLRGINWLVTKDYALSPAEFFWLCIMAVDKQIDNEKASTLDVIISKTLPGAIAGPCRAPCKEVQRNLKLDRNDIERAVGQVKDYLQVHQQIPPEVWIGSQAVTPERFLLEMVRTLDYRSQIRQKPLRTVLLISTDPGLLTTKHVADNGPHLWKWVIFPEGFSAPNVMHHARLQAWTLKPAIRQP